MLKSTISILQKNSLNKSCRDLNYLKLWLNNIFCQIKIYRVIEENIVILTVKS